ncbi:hypothetical protein UQ64_19285 [Paenibacillus etheri]|uniref:Enolase C-terminal domain-containing protein n=1 Tax=Paenibacillus etheri TaxID=1306852 RepID=A0A0W1AWD9_9BACL|nr:hypothetical protein UQ64_19285 [Paenibacillus etheri]
MLAAMPNAGYLEMHTFPIDQYTTRPLVINKDNGMAIAIAPEVTGTGVTFDWDKLAPHKQHY